MPENKNEKDFERDDFLKRYEHDDERLNPLVNGNGQKSKHSETVASRTHILSVIKRKGVWGDEDRGLESTRISHTAVAQAVWLCTTEKKIKRKV